MRSVMIQHPDKYLGQLSKQGSNQWKDTPNVFIVNGHIEKCDGNFKHEFTINQIPSTNIFIGPYPTSDVDVNLLKASGITACLDLLSKRDTNNLNINHLKIQHLIRKRGNISNYIHCPIDDFNGSGR